jgi:rod shape-determining protein MreC
MRFRKIDRFLLLLAGLFVVAILVPFDLPGEEMVPDLYRGLLHRPVLAQASEALSGPELDLVRLESELEAARHRIRELEDQLNARRELGAFFREIRWPQPPVAVPGWVFSVDSDVYRRIFRIDCGASDGVRKGMPVVTGKALLGVVEVVQANQGIVRRVDDPGFRIEIEVKTGEGYARGIAQGDGDRGLEVRFLRAARDLRKGTKVFTSSYDRMVPPGLLVGAIEEMEDPQRDGVLEVRVTPAASLGRLGQVEVLRRR